MKHSVDIHVGQKLKQIRKLRRLSQTEVGDKLELSFQQIQKYEMGTNRIAASRLFELSKILCVPTSYFFEGLNEETAGMGRRDPNTEIVKALAAIKDNGLKLRIMSFVNDVTSDATTRTH
ncbi:MAG: helix-turn-helix transcriptional regulator [Sulfitobacter sp.]